MVFLAAILVHSVLNVAGSLGFCGTTISAPWWPRASICPAGAYVLRRAVREGWISRLRLCAVLGLGLVLYVGLAALLLAAGRAMRPGVIP